MSDYPGFPFSVEPRRGQTARAGADRHIRDLIEQVLFTTPGERVNRPDFGCALGHMLFEAGDESVAAAVGVMVQGALDQWLGNLITVDAVEVTAAGAALSVVVRYAVRRTGTTVADEFTRAG